MGKIPFEIILKIYDYCDIDTKLKLHKIFYGTSEIARTGSVTVTFSRGTFTDAVGRRQGTAACSGILGAIFFTKKRRSHFLKSQPEKFLKVLNAVLRFKLNHIEIVTIISRAGRDFEIQFDNDDF